MKRKEISDILVVNVYYAENLDITVYIHFLSISVTFIE